MVPVADDRDSPSRSIRSTPNRQPIDLPRIPSASKGGCWYVLARSVLTCDNTKRLPGPADYDEKFVYFLFILHFAFRTSTTNNYL